MIINPYEKEFRMKPCLAKTMVTVSCYQGCKNGVLEALNYKGGEIFAYLETGGSNLDIDDAVFDPKEQRWILEKDIYPQYDMHRAYRYRP